MPVFNPKDDVSLIQPMKSSSSISTKWAEQFWMVTQVCEILYVFFKILILVCFWAVSWWKRYNILKVPFDTEKQKTMDVPDADFSIPSLEQLVSRLMKPIVIFLNGKNVFNVLMDSTLFQNTNSGLIMLHAVSFSDKIYFGTILNHSRLMIALIIS